MSVSRSPSPSASMVDDPPSPSPSPSLWPGRSGHLAWPTTDLNNIPSEAPDLDPAEDSRLRKKFRGRVPHDIVAVVTADTHQGHEEKALRLVMMHPGVPPPRFPDQEMQTVLIQQTERVESIIGHSEVMYRFFVDTLVWQSVTEMAKFSARYATLLSMLASRMPKVAPDVLAGWEAQMQAALAQYHGVSARLLMRFLAHLVGAKLVKREAYVAQVEAILVALESPSFSAQHKDYFAYLAMSSLLWSPESIEAPPPSSTTTDAFSTILDKLGAYMESRATSLIPGTGCENATLPAAPADAGLFVGGAGVKVPGVPDLLNQLWLALAEIRSADDAPIRGIDRPYDRVSGLEAAQGTVGPILPPSKPTPEDAPYLRPAVTLFGVGSMSSAKVATAFRVDDCSRGETWMLRELITDTLCTYHPFHSDAADALLNLRVGFPTLPFIVEQLLVTVLMGPTAYHPPLYYACTLFDLCKREPSGVLNNALAMGVRVLFKYAPAIDETAMDALSLWLTHHTSNFGFRWMWEEWVPSLSLPDHHAQKRFAVATFEREFRLVGPWHREKTIKTTVPDAMLSLVPPHPAPQSSLFPTGPSTDEGAPHAALFRALKEKLDDEEMEEHLGDTLPVMKDRAHVFMHAIMVYGHANYRNATTLFTRYQGVLQGLSEEAGCLHVMTDAVNDVWKGAPHVICVLLQLMVDAGVCPPAGLIQWMFDTQAAEPIKCLRYTTWEWVTAVLQQAEGIAANNQAVLDSARAGGEDEEDVLEVLEARTKQSNTELDDAVMAVVKGFLDCWGRVATVEDAELGGYLSRCLWARLRGLFVKFRPHVTRLADGIQRMLPGGAPATDFVRAMLAYDPVRPRALKPLLRDVLYPGQI